MTIRMLVLIMSLSLVFHSCGPGPKTFFVQIDVSSFDRGVTVEEVIGSGFVVAGYTTQSPATREDALLVRTNLSGDTLWTKTFGGEGEDYGWAVRQTGDGGFIIAGYSDSFGNGGNDVYLIRTDSEGTTLWTKTFGGEGDEFGWDIRQAADGGFIIAAQSDSDGHGDIDAYLIKLDSAGNKEWENFYGGEKIDRIFSVQQTADGGYVATGISYSFTSIGPQDRDGYLLKTDAGGKLEWFKTFGGDGYDVAHSIALTDDGGYLLSGYGESFATNGARDLYLIKTDAEGNEQWTKVHGGSAEERGIKGYQTSDGGYIAVGFTDKNRDIYLIKADSAGDMLWDRTFGRNNMLEFGYTVREASDGGYIITGHQQSFDGTNGDVLLIKTDSEGDWQNQ